MKKIIAIVAVIATITACFCIGANAYEAGDTIPKGTIIEFKDTISFENSSGFGIDFEFESNGTSFNSISKNGYSLLYGENSSQTINQMLKAYNGENHTWTQNYNRIKFKQDYVVSSNPNVIKLFSDNNIAEITPPVIENVLNKTNATFATTLTVATAIIAWLMANQIALVGLYIYILVALIATGKRFITGV